jgi:Ca-activated chloride channel family protein
MSALAQFHFLRPLALLLLLALPMFWAVWRGARSDAGAWRAAVDAHLLPHLIERIDGGSGRSGLALAAIGWTIACLALAGPAWEREPMPLYRNQAARVLALELSPTMLAQDEKPNRLSRARYKLDDALTRSRDFQTALIGYGGDAFVAAPLTDDVATVSNLVAALDPSTMPVSGNATGRAIRTAVSLIEQAGLHRGEVILFADSADAEAVTAAREARAQGVLVSVLGIGRTSGAPVPLAQGDFLKDASGNVVVSRLDEASLRAVTEAGGGRYAALTADGRDLDALLGNTAGGIGRGGDAAPETDAAESARWRDRGPWMLLLLLPIALAGFRRGWLMMLAFAVLPLSQARAASFDDLWKRSDQQAAAALARGDAKKAESVARSPDWRAGAAYRAGDYQSAASEYGKLGGADAAYNRGNALAKLGRYEDALAAYDEALKQSPDMADAKANRQTVEAFIEQSKRNEQPQQNDKSAPQNGNNGDKQPHDKDTSSQKDGQSGDGQQDKSQENQPQKDEQGQEGDSKKPSGDAQDQNKEQQRQDDAQAGEQQKSQDGMDGQGSDRQERSEQKAKADAQQQQALSKSIDEALAGSNKPADKKDAAQTGAAEEDEASREKRQALDHLLQRVPDDPGGLLRRKFQLEYQRRQQRGGDGE